MADREYFEEQWGLNNTGQQHTAIVNFLGLLIPTQVSGTVDADIDAPEAWDITTGDASVKIGILDTGVDCDSIEHIGKCFEEVNFVSAYSNTLEDIRSHGTHVAGIAAVHTNNSIGVAGTGWNSSIGNLKTCFEYLLEVVPELIYQPIGVCPVSASATAITYAADNGYHVINMSYGADDLDENGEITLDTPPLHNQIQRPRQPRMPGVRVWYWLLLRVTRVERRACTRPPIRKSLPSVPPTTLTISPPFQISPPPETTGYP